MKSKRVFICYSHKDAQYFERLRVHLKPYEDQGLVTVWTDQEIGVGDEWDDAIQQRLDTVEVAIVLVSADLLASDYVTTTEIPRLMRRVEAREITLAPLFIKPEADRRFEIQGRQVRFGKYQGLNTPQQPLANLPEAERERVLRDGLRRLLVTPPETVPSSRRKDPREPLVVRLEDDGKEIRRQVVVPFGTRQSLVRQSPKLTAALDGSEEGGDFLFDLLFGDAWQTVLGRFWGDRPEEVGSPLKHGTRLRILTTSPRLRGLPWERTTWNGHPLRDLWTLELASREDPPPLYLRTPGFVLMIGAGEDRDLVNLELHHQTFANLLGQLWRSKVEGRWLRFVTTAADLRQALVASPYSLVYLYGAVRGGKQGPECFFPDGSVSLREIQESGHGDPPKVVVLHNAMDVPRIIDWPGAALLLHLRADDGDEGRRLARRWWSRFLGEDKDPVETLYQNSDLPSIRVHLATDYQHWTTEYRPYISKVDRPRRSLDRRKQRDAARGAIKEWVHLPEMRAACLLAYGAPGNMLSAFVEQLLHTMEEFDIDRIRLERHGLTFPRKPASRPLSPDDFKWAVFQGFEGQSGSDLGEILKVRSGGGAMPVLLLDWGTCALEGEDAVTRDDLITWERFSRERLAAADLSHLRIVSYLSLRATEDRQPNVKALAAHFAIHDSGGRHDFRHLPPLDRIEAEDLHHFLKREENTSCPEDYLPDVVERILAATRGGVFKEVVELLEQAEDGLGWPEVYRNLPQVETSLTDLPEL